MRFRTLGIGLLAATTAIVVCETTYAGFVRKAVAGRLTPAAEDGRERGRFALSWVSTDRDRVIDRIEVSCKHLDATADTSGNLPVYDLWLITSDSSASVDFGDLTLTRRGVAGFRFNSRVDTLPDGVESVADFSGGSIEVRSGDTVVLSGTIPTFQGPGDDGASGAVGVRRDSSRLTPATGTRGRGTIEARYARRADSTNEQIWAKLGNLSRNGSPYTVVAIDGSSTETELFELTPRGRFGEALGVIDTRRGDTIPGGSVLDLSEQSVEVRDKDGNVVLSGTFPTISID